jgi:DNA-binding NtrC family response regulator
LANRNIAATIRRRDGRRPADRTDLGADNTTPARPNGRFVRPAQHNGMSKRILLVDDEESIRSLLSSSLEQRGFEVTTADSASETLRLTHEATFDLVLLDLSLPDSSGLGLLDLIKTALPDLPVVIITDGLLDKQLIQDARDKGALDCLSKMHSLDQVMRKVERTLRGR